MTDGQTHKLVDDGRRLVLKGIGAAGLLLLAGCGQSRPTVDLYIQSDGDFLAYKPDTLSCPTGAQVHLTFHHAGKILSQEHDWVLVRPGTMDEVVKACEKAGEDNGYVAKDDPRIIAYTPMCKKGETVGIHFIAPAPGDYPFFCSTPGHAETMHGILHVTQV